MESKEILSVYYEIHTNTLMHCNQKVEIFTVKSDGTYSNH